MSRNEMLMVTASDHGDDGNDGDSGGDDGDSGVGIGCQSPVAMAMV